MIVNIKKKLDDFCTKNDCIYQSTIQPTEEMKIHILILLVKN